MNGRALRTTGGGRTGKSERGRSSSRATSLRRGVGALSIGLTAAVCLALVGCAPATSTPDDVDTTTVEGIDTSTPDAIDAPRHASPDDIDISLLAGSEGGGAAASGATPRGALTCDYPGLNVPEKQFYTLFPYGKSVGATVGFAERFGQIGASFYLHRSDQNSRWWEGLNVLEGISAAGAGWQTSIIAQTEGYGGGDRVFVFNQAAGNMAQQWGYTSTPQRSYLPSGLPGVLTRFTHQQWLPIFSDHTHRVSGVVPDFSTSTPNTPCNGSATQYFDGKLDIRSRGSAVLGADRAGAWDSSHVIHINKRYQLQATRKSFWRYFKVEQAFYMDKWIAALHDLRIYLIGPGGAWVKGPIHPHWDRHLMPNLNHDPLSDVGQPLRCNVWGDERCSVVTPNIAIALLVWTVDGQQIGLAIHRPDLRPYFGDLARSVSVRCDATKYVDAQGRTASWNDLITYHHCGNLEWHSFVHGRRDLEREAFAFEQGQQRGFEMTYTVGTFRELIQFAEDRLPTLRVFVDAQGRISRRPR